jgi:hypothetical protein
VVADGSFPDAKREMFRADTTKPDQTKSDAAKPDGPKLDAPKPDAPKPDTPMKPDVATPDAQKPDVPKKPDAPKPDQGPPPPKCGDGVVNGSEQCDGAQLAGKSCQTQGFECGPLACSTSCTFDISGCRASWAKGFSADSIDAVTQEPSGAIYIAGRFTPPAVFGSTTLTKSNLFIAKLDSKGLLLSAVEPPTKLFVDTMALDAAGNMYVAGTFTNAITIGTTTLVYEGDCREMFAARINADGSFGWATKAGGPGSHCETPHGLAIDGYGNPYVTGAFDDPAWFGSTKLTNGVGFIARMDGATGKYTWAKATGLGLGAAAAVDANSLFFAGHDVNDVFLIKVDPATGSFLWTASAGGSSSDFVMGLSLGTGGTAYVTGATLSTSMSFGGAAIAGPAAYVAKAAPGGTWSWATTLPSYSPLMPIRVAAGTNLYAAVSFVGTQSFGAWSLTSVGAADLALVKLDAGTGAVVSATSGGGTGNETGSLLGITPSGRPLVAGTCQTPAVFGGTTIGSGATFMWSAACVP